MPQPVPGGLYSLHVVCRISAMSTASFQKVYFDIRHSSLRFYRIVSWAGFCLLVTALMGFSVTRAMMAVHECQWPIGWDLLRDVSMGQVMLDGRYPADPILLNKTLWYNPLTGAMLALGHVISGLSMPRVGVLIGPFVNLLAPLGVTVLAACLFGRAAALAGLCLVLFGRGPQVSIWVCFSYTPWMMASLYAAGMMLFLFAIYHKALEHRSCMGHIAAGLLLGIVFMAHTAPAIVAGGAMVLYVAWEEGRLCWESRVLKRNDYPLYYSKRAEAQRLALFFVLMLVVAFLISLPYTWSILWNYGFQVRNPSPSLFALDYVLLEQLPSRVMEALNWRNGFALLGLCALVYHRNRAAKLVLCWTLTVCLLLVQQYLWQLLETRYGIIIPGIVPGHHGSIHLTALRAVLFGIGIASFGGLISTLAGKFRAWRRGAFSPRFFSALSQTIRFAAACMAGFLLYTAHPLTTHPDFQQPDMVLYHQYHQRGIPVYEWILEHTAPDAVFICNEDELAMTIVMPAARKLLFPPYIYSNPFVDPGPLSYHNRLLVESVAKEDATAFCAEKNKYANVYMILREEEIVHSKTSYAVLFTEVFRAEGLVVFEARSCSEILKPQEV